MAKNLIIYGSSHPQGETFRAAEILARETGAGMIDVAALDIGLYDYAHRNLNDDFLAVSQRMLAADTIIFVTPVYWYAMSAQMKIFFDRLSDLVTVRKPDGRALAGKNTYLVANGTESAMPDGFEIPFERTSAYLNMHYRGSHYLYTGKDAALREKTWAALPAFARQTESLTQSSQRVQG